MGEIKVKPRVIDCETASNKEYDVVIVGAGVAGAIVAKQLSEQGKTVLIVEAGSGKDLTLEGYQSYVDHFHSAVGKDNNAPYPRNPNAPSPRSPDVSKLIPGQIDASAYLVQRGPLALDSTYTRATGGTTMHWEGKTPRMLPGDFKLRSTYGQGLDWPFDYDHLMPYYRIAERELGVSGNVEDQIKLGGVYKEDYVFPMKEMPPSYLDKTIKEKIDNSTVELDGETYTLDVLTFPQARNGIPNPDYYKGVDDYREGDRFDPDGLTSVHPVEYGERCQGNANCVPICPVQAKYDARKTLGKAFNTERVDILPQAVASKIEINPENNRVTAVHFKCYQDKNSPKHETGIAKGKLFVLAANAVENARLLLSSNLPTTKSSELIGRHLMDHPYVLCWGLMPEVTGTMRGPLCTSGIVAFRKGDFRHKQGAFAIDIHNDGWGWATGSPDTDVLDIIDNKNKYGKGLREELVSKISRQLLLACMCELPADPSNRVTIDPNYTDPLGNYRPVISFNISDYCKRTLAYARYICSLVFQRLGAEEYTHYDPSDYGYFTYEGEGYVFRGGNHYAGTHVMGTSPDNSVVDKHQRSWDHKNLYLVGAGSMPTIGSSNTTVTLSAMTFYSTEQMLKDLN